jgi:hypothetical protein
MLAADFELSDRLQITLELRENDPRLKDQDTLTGALLRFARECVGDRVKKVKALQPVYEILTKDSAA